MGALEERLPPLHDIAFILLFIYIYACTSIISARNQFSSVEITYPFFFFFSQRILGRSHDVTKQAAVSHGRPRSPAFYEPASSTAATALFDSHRSGGQVTASQRCPEVATHPACPGLVGHLKYARPFQRRVSKCASKARADFAESHEGNAAVQE